MDDNKSKRKNKEPKGLPDRAGTINQISRQDRQKNGGRSLMNG